MELNCIMLHVGVYPEENVKANKLNCALCRVLDSFLFNGLMNDREVEVKTNSCRTSGGVTHIVLIII